MNHLDGSYNLAMVLLSITIVIFASYTALDLLDRIKESGNGLIRKYWLSTASIAMGGGIWTMHYIGMLAFYVNYKEVEYDLYLLILSVIFPIISSSICFYVVSRRIRDKWYLLLSGLIMGIGIASMHYTGMLAMHIKAQIEYDKTLFLLSILIGIVSSNVALWIFSRFADEHVNRKLWIKVVAAIFLGGGISCVHYTGMAATHFIPDTNVHLYEEKLSVGVNLFSALSVGASLFFILIFILMSGSMDRYSSIKLKESEERYRRLVELSPNGIAIHEFGEFRYVNLTGLKILGAETGEQLIGKNILDFIHPNYHEIVKRRWKTIREQDTHVSFIEEKFIRLDKEIIDVEIMAMPITHNGKQYVQVFFQDISERKKAEILIHQMAYHDILTGLPNRRMFMDYLNKALMEAKLNRQKVAVMFIDLDGFKQVNDRFGHGVGDLLLQDVAQRIKNSVRQEDTTSRLAGDEFTILISDTNKEKVRKDALRILEALRAPSIIHSYTIHISPSIGISLYPDDGEDGEMLMKHADIAMYEAKKVGKNNFQFYKIVH
ncbi:MULTISPECIES: diguanylate cyclase [unclassified Paenibacillus]|uniref:diguanylate cyclase domain-containing protein n=1 Tax=unclassified Paenibacillus TaxID=185978 RepID=UPI001AE47564|nr:MULTISPECIES: diguanylate cyclase [unclassified Paenibacillus]MBP1153724.1 diguanylate cyclase (GGDEF)-like protein/PAS domain S-box-containing protein [Paenibacillus sp. PvP091]MBP1170891.1 diguanylate cyclase (GGDEF)-like protein/PAS domain S-box-containing protein [Paenibacillus sp. PvR098]MBP2441919.1 diguanylate cyclase (GGDEF)-like protein/PAS domain S-box-containing protein [Paenibacillus sp. PvP052]